MPLCLEGILTKQQLDVSLASETLQPSVSHAVHEATIGRKPVVAKLKMRAIVDDHVNRLSATMSASIPCGMPSIRRGGVAPRLSMSHRTVKASASTRKVKGKLKEKIDTKAVLTLYGPTATITMDGTDSYFTVFCPIDYLKSCFSLGGWNDDAAWDNDEGWYND